MKVVCNSGPLMALGKIGQVHLLYPLVKNAPQVLAL